MTASPGHELVCRLSVLVSLTLAFVLTSCGAGAPQAKVSANVRSGQAPLNVTFESDSEDATELRWDFGDGAGETSTGEQPSITHKYTKAGTHTVSLTAI